MLEEPKEVAKATGEIAKTTGKGIDATRELGGFLNTVCGGGFIELGQAFKDWATAYKYYNTIKIRDKFDAFCKQRKLEGKTIPLPPRHAIPLLEAASLESDDSLQDMWAALITNATDPKKQFNINKLLIEILSKLEPLDAEILSHFGKLNFKAFMMHGKPAILLNLLIDDLSKEIIASEKDIELSLQNLNRLGCIDIPKEATEDNAPDPFSIIEAPFNLTLIGSSLMEACKK